MQLTPRREQTIEKIIRDADGRLVKATFCVYEQGGRIKARLIEAVVLDEIKNQTLSLGTRSKISKYVQTILQTKVVSPYFNTSLIYALGSRPRAPTF